jgi:hypothetical protein
MKRDIKKRGVLYNCGGESGKIESISAFNEEDARRIYFARFGSWPTNISSTGIDVHLPLSNQYDALSGVLAPQKIRFKHKHLYWVFFLWNIIISPLGFLLREWQLPDFFSAEDFFTLTGHSAAFSVVALGVHYIRIFLENYIVLGDPIYNSKRMSVFMSSLLTGILLGMAVTYLPGKEKYLFAGISGLAAFVFPWIFALRGGLKSLNNNSGFRSFLFKIRKFPYIMILLSILSIPAVFIAAELCRFLFIRWFIVPLWPLMERLFFYFSHGGKMPAINFSYLFSLVFIFILYGTLLYGVLVVSFDIKRGASDKEEKSGKKRNPDTPIGYRAIWFFISRLLPWTLFYLFSLILNYGFFKFVQDNQFF